MDRLPEMLATASEELADETGLPAELILAQGAVPSYYLAYYYLTSDKVEAQGIGKTRAEEVMEIERKLLDLYRDPKLVTKPGPDQSPIYAFLTKTGDVPSWNFCKYLIGKDGKVIVFFPSKITPESKELRDAVTAALGK